MASRIRSLICPILLVLSSCALRAPLAEVGDPELGDLTEGDLRVVVLNAWVVPFRHAHDALLDRLAERITELRPDIVALQEVWFREDALRLSAALVRGGLSHVRHRSSDQVWAHDSSGLLIASRHPIIGLEFHQFLAGRSPMLPWHPDWFSGKGVMLARIQTPGGVVDVVNLHLHADYEGASYADIRAAQAIEAATFLRERLSAPLRIVAGDFNGRRDAIEVRLLRASAAVHPLVDDDIDAIYGGGRWGVAPARAGVTLLSPVSVGGESLRLSDHPGLFVDLRPEPAAGEDHPPGVSVDLLSEVDARLVDAAGREERLQILVASCMLSVLGALGWFWARGRRVRRRLGVRLAVQAIAAAALLLAAHQLLWMIPSRKRSYEEARSALVHLGEPTEAATRDILQRK